MSSVIPFPLSRSDREAEWTVQLAEQIEGWWEVSVLKDDRLVSSMTYGDQEEAWGAGKMLQHLHGWPFRASYLPSRAFSDCGEIPF